MGFVDKHLNDPFYMEGTTSISLRSIIFRELVANIIAHREYTSAAPATLMIYTDRVEFKNPNVPHFHGRIDPGNFTPYPKNPTICKFMIQLGRYEELGSGVRKVNHYLPHYAPGAGKPVFEDGDMFKVVVPLETPAAKDAPKVTGEVTDQDTDQDTDQVTDQVANLIRLLSAGSLTALQAMEKLNMTHRPTFRENYLHPALEAGLIERTIPGKPTSRLQKYRLTDKGRQLLNGIT